MYAKVFRQIFDSSIAEDYRVRFVFEDLLKLADVNGVVDMTHEAIGRTTNVPLEMVRYGIEELEKPDAKSRSKEHGGKRIVRVDEHRDWGWLIVNYEYYRKLASEEQRQERTRLRVKSFREKAKLIDRQACNAPVTLSNDSPSTSASAFACQQGKGMQGGRGFKKPVLEEVKLRGSEIALPEGECEKFFDYYEANGWRVGKNPMRMWSAALANWKRHWIEYGGGAEVGPGKKAGSEGDTFWKDKARMDMVEKELAAINGRASHTAMDVIIEPRDLASYKRLKAEKFELKRKLKL